MTMSAAISLPAGSLLKIALALLPLLLALSLRGEELPNPVG